MADYIEVVSDAISKIVAAAKDFKDSETMGKVKTGAKEFMEKDSVAKVVSSAKEFMESESVAKVKSGAKSFMEKDTVKAGTQYVKAAGDFVKGNVTLGGEYQKLKKAYGKLGKLFFENCKDCADEPYAEIVEEIKELLAVIEEAESAVSEARSSFAPAVAEDAEFEAVVDGAAEEEEEISVEVFEDIVSQDEQE